MAKHNRDYKPEDILFPNQAITSSNLVEEMEKSYIEYAMSVIVGRALPDVRDGLKPVHRRILYQAAACFTAAAVSVRASMLLMVVCRCSSTRFSPGAVS